MKLLTYNIFRFNRSESEIRDAFSSKVGVAVRSGSDIGLIFNPDKYSETIKYINTLTYNNFIVFAFEFQGRSCLVVVDPCTDTLNALNSVVKECDVNGIWSYGFPKLKPSYEVDELYKNLGFTNELLLYFNNRSTVLLCFKDLIFNIKLKCSGEDFASRLSFVIMEYSLLEEYFGENCISTVNNYIFDTKNISLESQLLVGGTDLDVLKINAFVNGLFPILGNAWAYEHDCAYMKLIDLFFKGYEFKSVSIVDRDHICTSYMDLPDLLIYLEFVSNLDSSGVRNVFDMLPNYISNDKKRFRRSRRLNNTGLYVDGSINRSVAVSKFKDAMISLRLNPFDLSIKFSASIFKDKNIGMIPCVAI